MLLPLVLAAHLALADDPPTDGTPQAAPPTYPTGAASDAPPVDPAVDPAAGPASETPVEPASEPTTEPPVSGETPVAPAIATPTEPETEEPAAEEPAAEEPAAEAPAEPGAAAPDEEPRLDLSEALKTRDLTTSEVKHLQPNRWKLPQNPYAQTDFTAYTLEWGEVKLGLAAITVGVLPRVQLGTAPILDILKVPNGNLKWDVVRAGPFDVAALGSVFVLPSHGFNASFIEAGIRTSVQIVKPWSFHLAGSFDRIQAEGLPDLTKISPLLLTGSKESIDALNTKLQEDNVNLSVLGNALSLTAATDVRFNRRDSLILQGSAIVWSSLATDLGSAQSLPPIVALGSLLEDTDKAGGPVPLTKSYVVSISYQASWKHVDARIGYGSSATPFAWVLPATDLSYRFGGKTRLTETRMSKTWLQNLQDAQKAKKAGRNAPIDGAKDDSGGKKKQK